MEEITMEEITATTQDLANLAVGLETLVKKFTIN